MLIYIVAILAPVVLAGAFVARARRGNPGDVDSPKDDRRTDAKFRDPYAGQGNGHI